MSDMIITARQQLAIQRIRNMEAAIDEGINKICKEHNYQITYAEINAAMLNVMKTHNGYELKELWKPRRGTKQKRKDNG